MYKDGKVDGYFDKDFWERESMDVCGLEEEIT